MKVFPHHVVRFQSKAFEAVVFFLRISFDDLDKHVPVFLRDTTNPPLLHFWKDGVVVRSHYKCIRTLLLKVFLLSYAVSSYTCDG